MRSVRWLRTKWHEWDDDSFFRRLSRAGLIAGAIWMIVLTTYNGYSNRAQLHLELDRVQRLEAELHHQTDLTNQAISQNGDIQRKLDVALAQNNALAEQIRQLGATPVAIAGSSTGSTSSTSSDIPQNGSGSSPSPTPGPQGPTGPQGPPGPSSTQPPTQPPTILDPICNLTAVLNLC